MPEQDITARTPVVIVGGGPVGPALALLLDAQDVACAVYDEGDAPFGHPRGNTHNARTMDTRAAKDGPTATEKCGRAAIASAQNQGAFKSLQPKVWRLLDDDGFLVNNPGFEHCTNRQPHVETTCAWSKV